MAASCHTAPAPRGRQPRHEFGRPRAAARSDWSGRSGRPALAFFLIGVVVQVATGGAGPSLADLARFSGLPELSLPVVVLIAFLGNCYGEEIGWRGFATPRLLKRHGLIVTGPGGGARLRRRCRAQAMVA